MTMMNMMTPEVLGGTMMLVVGFVYLLIKILAAIGTWKMYNKAGVAGWKAFVPVYSRYVRYNLFWDKKYFWIFAIAYIIMTALGAYAEGIMALVVMVTAIVVMVVSIKVEFKCARCFGMGTGMGILLLIMPWLANIILGFGKAEYQAIEE